MHQFDETGFTCTIARLLGARAVGLLGKQHIQAWLQIAEILESKQRAENMVNQAVLRATRPLSSSMVPRAYRRSRAGRR
jgi:hypothetical protein